MAEQKLKTKLFIDSLRRRCEIQNKPVMILQKGDPDAGGITLQLDDCRGSSMVLIQARSGTGASIWLRGTGPDPVPDAQASAYLDKQQRMDPDLWILVIEDPSFTPPVDDPIE